MSKVVLDANILRTWLGQPNHSMNNMTIPEFKALVEGALSSLDVQSNDTWNAAIDAAAKALDAREEDAMSANTMVPTILALMRHDEVPKP